MTIVNEEQATAIATENDAAIHGLAQTVRARIDMICDVINRDVMTVIYLCSERLNSHGMLQAIDVSGCGELVNNKKVC